LLIVDCDLAPVDTVVLMLVIWLPITAQFTAPELMISV